ncbi:FtsX-like permease family protein [uncultured Roseivirga sp.]|uniref:FtsX-like permease family protein n=1 Tax=uncultured Roseivirga sp. TaxID=543088 RepID=UPI0030D9D950|tara:strand:+ start:102627 stop:105233 length:2607 start_codon:yes stop_codon:yes gene_type:complete
MNQKTPQFSTRLLKLFCKESFHEELQGDLEEKFYANIETKGLKKAKSIYRKEVLKLMRPSVIKKPKGFNSKINTSLFKLHFVLTLRNIQRNKVFSLVNILGLGAALTICLFCVNMIYTGFQYDKYPDGERLYRITTKVEDPKNSMHWATSSFALKWKLDGIPQIEKSSTFMENMFGYYEVKGETIRANGYPIDKEFLDLFQFEVVEGNPYDLFNDLNSVIITDELAEKLYGDESAIGKQSKSRGIIRAVIKSPEGNSHFAFQFLINIGFMTNTMSEPEINTRFNKWNNFDQSYYTYFKLGENSKIEDVENLIAGFSEEMTSSMSDGNKYTMEVQPVSSIMFGNFLWADFPNVFPRTTLYVLLIPIIILISLASFNYTNLSIARSLQRSKEIGIRKIAGSSKKQVVFQFLIETVIFSLLALAIAFVSYSYISTQFEGHIQELAELYSPHLNLEIILWFIAFSIIVGLVAGILPALHFARVSPLVAIHKKAGKQISLSSIRKGLVGVQLCISTLCILFIVLISDQKQQLLAADLGFETSGLITIPTKKVDLDLLTAELDKIPEINSYTTTSMIPGTGGMTRRILVSGNYQDTISARYGLADDGFNTVYNPKLISGTGFTKDREDEIIVDENFLKAMNIPLDSALGSIVHIMHFDIQEDLQITGVLDNYVYQAMSSSFALPFIIRNQRDSLLTNKITLKLTSSNVALTLKKIEAGWSAIAGDNSFDPIFVDDQLEKSYDAFFNFMDMLKLAGITVIIIAILGQFGMALYSAESRVKEIGIRRVLGAQFHSIAKLISKGSVKALAISAIISVPLIYLIYQELIFPSFTIHLDVSEMHIILTLATFWSIVLGIVIFQTWQTAKANPSESLRSE